MIGGSAKNPLARAIASRLDDPLVMDGSVLLHGALGPVHQSGAQSFYCTSVRYVPDFEGLYREVPANVPACPGARLVVNEINPGATWVGAPYTRDTALAPNGSLTAATVVLAASGGTSQVYQTFDPGSAGRTLTQSVWIRLAVGTAAQINLGFYDGTQGYLMQVTVTDKWQRFSYTATMANYFSSTHAWKIKNDLSGSEQTINVWHPQCEDVTGQTNQNPSEYVVSPTWFDYENGNTVDANGVVTEARGADIHANVLQGVLDEKSATNVEANSSLDGPYWLNTGAAFVLDAVAPDVSATAGRIVEDSSAASAHKRIHIGLSVAAGSNTVSIFVKRGVGSRNVYVGGLHAGDSKTFSVAFDFDTETATGTNADAVGFEALGGVNVGWYRVWVSFTVTNTGNYTLQVMLTAGAATTYDGDGTSSIVAWGAQVESGSYPTSPIPTSGAAATRTATQRTLQTEGNIRENDWWALLAFTAQHDSADTLSPWEGLLGTFDDASGDRVNVFVDGGGQLTARRKVSGASVTVNISAVDLSWVQGDVVGVAARWSSTQGLTIFGTNATTGQGPVSATEYNATARADNIVGSALGFGAISDSAANGAAAIRHVETRFGDAPDSVILAAIEQIAARLV